jgi:hypothetical protein
MKRKRIITIAVLAVLAYLIYRATRGTATAGHSSPDDAMASGWAVYQRGITGWQEHGPNGEIIDHDSGWDLSLPSAPLAYGAGTTGGYIGSGDAQFLGNAQFPG